MPLQVIAGPAGSGKSQWMLDHAGRDDVVIDFGRLFLALFPALENVVRGDAERRALVMAAWLKTAAVRRAVELDLSGFVSTSDPGKVDSLLAMTGQQRPAGVKVIDPGRATVLSRLAKSQPGRDTACTAAVDGWYGRI